MIKGKIFYVTWMNGEDEQYYNQYETLEDAVREEPENEIFEVSPKSLGYFELKVTTKIKQKRKK